MDDERCGNGARKDATSAEEAMGQFCLASFAASRENTLWFRLRRLREHKANGAPRPAGSPRQAARRNGMPRRRSADSTCSPLSREASYSTDSRSIEGES